MRIGEFCKNCILGKNLDNIPAGATPEQAEAYRRRVREIVQGCGARSSPEVHGQISAAYREFFGPGRDYTEIKRRFNDLMLGLEAALQADVDGATDPLLRAVQYAVTGNFIDFAALGDVDEGELRQKLAVADGVRVDADALEALRREILSARRLVCFTDNCGEIVVDKVLLRTLRRMNPGLHVTVIVRGEPVVNDATLEDARQVGMEEVAQRVIGNGNDLPGNVLARLSDAAARAVDDADLMISKGQANYEGLCGCGRNIFYLFMCKCRLFTDRFGVPRFSGILTRETGEEDIA